MTVRRHARKADGCRTTARPRALPELEDWLRERFRRHGGNADIVRQAAWHSRAVAPLRCELMASASDAALRDAAGQADADRFWRPAVQIGSENAKVHLCRLARLLPRLSVILTGDGAAESA